MRFKYLIIFCLVSISSGLFSPRLVFADSTSGYAWSENTGWVDFSPVIVNDTELSGYAYSSNIGWISFNCNNTSSCGTVDYKVTHSGSTLSGYAWSENTGYIDFSQVSIDTNTGIFSGYAYSSNIGWISLNCSNSSSCGTVDYKVTTSWRPPAPPVQQGHPAPPPPAPPAPVVPVTPITPVTPTTPTTPVTPVAPTTPTTPVTPVTPTTPSITPTTPESPSETPTVAPENTTPSENVSTATPDILPPSGVTSANLVSQFFNQSSQVFSVVSGSIKQSLSDTKVSINKAKEEAKVIIDSPTGTVVSKAVATTGVVAGVTISVSSALFINPLSFSELFFIPMRLWALLMAALGIKKRNKPWGVVYDSITKQPLDPAYVVLQNLEGEEINTSITDLDGRYGFLVGPGVYKIIANKTNYFFPSKKLSGHFSDSLYSNIYWGDYFKVEHEGEVISKSIPLDPVNFDWNEFAKRDQKLMKFYSLKDLWISRVSEFLFYFGFTAITIAVLVAPHTYNILTFLLYVVLFILKHTVLKPHSHGTLAEKSTGLPLSFGVIRVFSVKTNMEMLHKVADKYGRYYCLIPNGNYYVKIEKKNLDESYTLIHTSEPITITEGFLGNNFEI